MRTADAAGYLTQESAAEQVHQAICEVMQHPPTGQQLRETLDLVRLPNRFHRHPGNAGTSESFPVHRPMQRPVRIQDKLSVSVQPVPIKGTTRGPKIPDLQSLLHPGLNFAELTVW